MQGNILAKFLIIGAVLVALFALGRGLFYFDNDEVEIENDSGLSLVNSQVAQVSGSKTGPQAEEFELPSRLIIPKLEIEADVQRLGVTRSGNMAAPNNFTDVSWYKYGTVPGFKGSAVMAGHVDNALSTPAVFYNLKDLEIGDDIYVVRADGKRLHYKVVDEQTYQYNDTKPLQRIFNATDGSYLNIITCQGEWVPEAKSARYRLVIYTKLVE